MTEVPAGVFAGLLRRYRHREGLSQEALAEACGMSNRAVSDLERGVSRPRARTVRMLAEVLRLSAAERAEFVSAVPAVTRPTGAAFAGLLRAHRTAAHLSQAELAARALISARAISDLERGMNRAPRRQTVILLSDALELDGTACAEFHAAARAALTAAHPSSRPEARQSPDGSLPLFPWPLIGREQELDRLLELVADPSVRLLTLTGMGGVGKTRLAAEVGAILAGRGDRVVFVTLTAARTASEAVDAMVAALGVTDADEATVLAAVGRSIAAERTTLVLDNVEQIPDAARIVSAVVAGAAGSGVPGGGAAGTVVVTSRVVLRLTGERELPVSPLAAAPSGRLFAERARAASPEWTPLESDAGVLAEVCRQMDGLPLALELLAPWVRVLPLRVIRDRLATGLDLVSAANADVAARHRSLSVVLDASHLLLDPATQAVFRRLAVFPAAFEAETAEAVCGGHDDASPDGREINVLSAVAALRDASLLTAERDSDGELRLCYLHIVREYAAAALAGSGELAWMRARHAAAFARLAEIAAPRLTLADQGFWLERLDRAVDDLRAALAWYLAQDDATSVVRMSGNLWRYWYLRGLPREGRNWLRQALAAPGCGRDAADSVPAGTDVATAQYGAGVLTYLIGEIEPAQDLYRSAQAAYLAAGDHAGAANCLNNLGMIELYRASFNAARKLHEQALSEARLSGSDRAEGVSLANLAKVCAEDGRPGEAAVQAREALVIFAELGDRRTIADLRGLLAECAIKEDRRDDARELWLTALSAFTELGDRSGCAPILVELGTLDLEGGDLSAAMARFEAASAMADEMQEPWTQAIARVGLARHAYATGHHAQARTFLDVAEALARKAQDVGTLNKVRDLHRQWSEAR